MFLMTVFFFFSTTSAEKVKADKDVAALLKELGLRVSKFLVSEGAFLIIFFYPFSWCWGEAKLSFFQFKVI